jgi:hypothetical protein
MSRLVNRQAALQGSRHQFHLISPQLNPQRSLARIRLVSHWRSPLLGRRFHLRISPVCVLPRGPVLTQLRRHRRGPAVHHLHCRRPYLLKVPSRGRQRPRHASPRLCQRQLRLRSLHRIPPRVLLGDRPRVQQGNRHHRRLRGR